METKIGQANNILVCNKCGRVVDISNPDNLYISNIVNIFHDFYVNFNYLSPRDGMEGKCKICECCIMKFINSFKIPLKLTKYDIFESKERPIEELDLSVRAYCALKRARSHFFNDFLKNYYNYETKLLKKLWVLLKKAINFIFCNLIFTFI